MNIMKPKKPKVLLAMSGGVDSSVAALLLKKQGYEVIGCFMKNWSDTKNDLGECLWRGERRHAIKIASLLGIPLITLDFEKQYRKLVVNEMFKKYKKGITPNPDIDCNEKVKFPLLLKAAKKLKCDYLATGHYARIKRTYGIETSSGFRCIQQPKSSYDISLKLAPKADKNLVGKNVNDKNIGLNFKGYKDKSKNYDKKLNVNGDFNSDFTLTLNNKYASEASLIIGWVDGGLEEGKKHRYHLLRANDELKDQSYFLYRLKNSQLKHILFPIGGLTKKEVRKIAEKNKFPNYNKKSTVGICFIGKVNLKKFLQKKIKSKPGKILDPEGNVIGIHDGIYYYTIGQRLGPRFGLEISKPEKYQKKYYVARKDLKKNIIMAAPEGHELNYRKEIAIRNPNWINEDLIISLNRNNTKKNSSFNNKDINSELRAGGWGIGRRDKPTKVLSRIRQVGELLPSKLFYDKKTKKFRVILNKAIIGVSDGQAIVLYKGKEVLGGGVISFL